MKHHRLTVATHLKVAALYETIWHVEPPQSTPREQLVYERTIAYAAARRWLPPMAWDDIDTDIAPPVPDKDTDVDEIALELALAGEHVRLTKRERAVAVARAHERRWSDERTAATIHCTPPHRAPHPRPPRVGGVALRTTRSGR